MSDGRAIGYFCLGCAAGIAAAVLFTPKSGEETKAFLRRKANEGAEYVRRSVDEAQSEINKAVNQAKNAVSDEIGRLNDALNAGTQAYRRGGRV
jgi:gas vesicle protein